MNRECRTCRFFCSETTGSDGDYSRPQVWNDDLKAYAVPDEDIGECRRARPTIFDEGLQGRWPRVWTDFFCGEWESTEGEVF